MKILKNEAGDPITSQKNISAEQAKFYKKLYQSAPTVHFTYINHTDKKVTQIDKDKLD